MSQKNNYTKLVFNHPINYTFMTAVMLAFVSGNTVAGVFGAIVEALSMWMVPDLKSVQLSIVMKNLKVSVPFEAQVHFEGTTFTQSYSGVWNGIFAYEYEVINGNQGSSY